MQRLTGDYQSGPWFDFADDFFSQVPVESLPQELPTNNEVGKPVPVMSKACKAVKAQLHTNGLMSRVQDEVQEQLMEARLRLLLFLMLLVLLL